MIKKILVVALAAASFLGLASDGFANELGTHWYNLSRPNNHYRNHINQPKPLITHQMPRPVPTQITDSVTQANVKVLGNAPSLSVANVYQSEAHSTIPTNLAKLNQQNLLHHDM